MKTEDQSRQVMVNVVETIKAGLDEIRWFNPLCENGQMYGATVNLRSYLN